MDHNGTIPPAPPTCSPSFTRVNVFQRVLALTCFHPWSLSHNPGRFGTRECTSPTLCHALPPFAGPPFPSSGQPPTRPRTPLRPLRKRSPSLGVIDPPLQRGRSRSSPPLGVRGCDRGVHRSLRFAITHLPRAHRRRTVVRARRSCTARCVDRPPRDRGVSLPRS